MCRCNATSSRSGRSQKRRCQMPRSRRAMRTSERYSPAGNRRQNPDLIRPPPPGIVTVAFRQAPYAVQMLRQHHDRDHLEGLCQPGRTERRAQIIDMIHQQPPPAFQQIHGEEERAARHVFAAIARHGPACRRSRPCDIGKVRSPHRNPPQRMHRPRKARQGPTPGGLGRVPARRHVRVMGLVYAEAQVSGNCKVSTFIALPEAQPKKPH